MPTVTERIGHHALAKVLAGRTRALHRLYKADGADPAMVLDVPLEQSTVDESGMAIHNVVISTSAADRVGDILIPTGLVVDNYQKNPVVLWDHGFSAEDGGSLPIAMCEDKAGNLALAADESGVIASAYFHGQTPLSTQVFGLVAAKAIRAASVRPEPIETDLVVDEERDMIGVLMLQWGLAEWSFVAVGCNQDTLVKAIRERRFEGETLARPLLHTFKSLGIRPAQGIGMALNTNPTPVKEVVKSTPKGSDADEDKTKAAEPAGEPEEHETPEPAGDDAGSEPVSDETHMKYGAQYLSALHNGVGQLVNNAKQGMGALENESVIEVVTAAIANLEDLLAGIEGTYSGQYSDMPALGKTDDTADEEEEQAESLKSFLRSGVLVQSQFNGFAGRLKELLGAKNLTGPQKLKLEATVKGMQRLLEQARTHEETAMAKKLKLVEDKLAALTRKLEDRTPHLHIASPAQKRA